MNPRIVKSVLVPFLLALSCCGQSSPSVAADKPAADNRGLLLKEARQLYCTGKFDSAIEKYRAALAVDPKSAEAYAGMVHVHLKQERLQLANEDAIAGIAADPESGSMQTALGELYFRQGKIGEAEQQFIKVVNGGATDVRAYLGLARVRDAIAMYRKAKDFIDRAHDLDATDPDIQRFWMQTLNRSERARVLEAYLASPTNDDADDREDLVRHLAVLKEAQKQPDRRCALVSKPMATETALHPMLIDANHLYGLGLNVSFNGQASRLLLDTGASGILIKRSIAEKAGITKIAQSKIEGIGDKGGASGYYGYATSIRIGDLEFRDCLIEVSETRSILGDDGVIGTDVFSDYFIRLDLSKQKLKLSELPKRPAERTGPATLKTGGRGDYSEDDGGRSSDSSEKRIEDPAGGPRDRYIAPEMHSFTPTFRFGHSLLIPARIGDGPAKLFLIDTGSMTNFISADAARQVTKVHGDRDTIIKGLSGTVANVFRADKATLQFSHYRQENQDMAALDLSKISKNLGTEVSGILGFTTLRMFEIKIDYRDGLVDFVFDEDRFGR